MMPPLIAVGSSPAASNTAATIEVVVVFPWVPPTATDHLRHISSASISARRTTGMRRARAAAISGLSGLIAGGRAADVRPRGGVPAVTAIAEVVKDLGDPAHADAADADEMDRADGKWQEPH